MKTSLNTKTFDRVKSLFATNGIHVHIVLILFLGIVSYSNSLAVPEQFDDQAVLRARNHVGSNLYCIQSFIGRARWLTDISFSLNRQLHGERVFGFHLVNLTVHLASAVIIYMMLQRAIEALKKSFLISEVEPFLCNFIPFTAAALFVCHPIQTQAVTYITQRYTSLATLFYLSSLLSYLLARISFVDRTKKLRIWSWGLACLFLALLAMKSKEIAFTLPLMIVVIEIALFRGKWLKSSLYPVAVAALLLVIPLQLIYTHVTKSSGNLFRHLYIATTETPSISRIDYLLTQFRVMVTYLRLLFFPINQNMDYDYPIYHSLFNPHVFFSLLLHVVLLGLALALFIQSKRQFSSGTGDVAIIMRLASMGIVWFYLALSVESSLFPIRDVIFEHRIYLSSVGFFMVMAAGIAGIAIFLHCCYRVLWVAVVLICLALTTATIARNRVWSSEMVMWRDVLEKSPNKARASYNLGFQYYKRYKLEQALPHLVRALELDTGMVEYWNTLNNTVSLIVAYEGRTSSGHQYGVTDDNVYRLHPELRKPWLANNYNSLGLVYEHLGNLRLAQENYLKAATVNPFLDLAWFNMALVSARQNNTSKVALSLERLRAISPPMELYAVELFKNRGYSVP